MNEILNTFLLMEDKFMLEMHLKQPGFTYNACGPFTKNKERIEKFMQPGDTNSIYKNELDKTCFQHDMAYGKTYDLIKRIQSDKVLKDKAFKIASDPNYEKKFFDKKSSESDIVNEPNYHLANALDKPIIRKF